MSSFKRIRERSHGSGTKEPLYTRQRREALNKLKKSMKTLCDDESSTPSNKKPSVFKNQLDTTSSDETDNEGDLTHLHASLVLPKSDKHKHPKNKRSNYNNVKNDNKKIDSDTSDSEDNVNGKGAEWRDRQILSSRAKDKLIASQDNVSSSSTEFRKSKISHVGSKMMKKINQDQKENHANRTDLNSKSTDETTTESHGKVQGPSLESSVNDNLNKMKQLCSIYEELHDVRWNHSKEDKQRYDEMVKTYGKLINLIESIKAELMLEEQNLLHSYENCEQRNNLLAETEESNAAVKEKETEKLEMTPREKPIVSDCEFQVFSSNEAQTATKEDNRDKIVEPPIPEKSMNDDSSVVEASPIMQSRIMTVRQTLKAVLAETPKLDEETEDSEETSMECLAPDSVSTGVDLTERMELIEEPAVQEVESKDCPTSDSVNLNTSADDSLFNEITTEIITSSPRCDDDLETDIPLDKDSSDTTINERKRKREPSLITSDDIEGEIDNDLKKNDEEEWAKRALLTSDSDSTGTNPPAVSDVTTAAEWSENDVPKATSAWATVQPDKKRKRISESESEDKSPEDLSEAPTVSKLLESDSDGSLSCSEKLASKKGLKNHVNSDGSSTDLSSDDENKSDEKGQKEKKGRTSSIEKQDSSSKDSTNDSESSGRKRYSLRKKNAQDKKDLNLFKELLKTKLKNVSMDKIFVSKVVLERLPETVLNRHKNALEKSRKYLEGKEFKNLINLDGLKRNTRSSSVSLNTSISQLCKTPKTKSKETEALMLDHIEEKDEEADFDDATAKDHLDSSQKDTVAGSDTCIQSNEDFIKQADAVAKKLLLCSSDSDGLFEKEASSGSGDEEKSKIKSGKSTVKEKAKSKEKDSDKEYDEERQKSAWRTDKVLTMKLSSDSDSDVAREKWAKKQKLAKTEKSDQAEDSDKNVDSAVVLKRKPRTPRKIMDSDESDVKSEPDSDSSIEVIKTAAASDSDSSVGKPKKGKKHKKSSDSDSTGSVKKTRPKRRRIKKMPSDSDADSDDDQMNSSQGTPGKKGRKNIRKVMEEELVADDTKQAAKAEEERLKRIAEKNKLYNAVYEARLAGEEKVEKLVLDIDTETKEELVVVHQNLVKRLKPHQARGIKFMWDACFETLEMAKTSPGSGCIIAHCMGLGKSLQVIALVHTLLTHEQINVKTVLIVTPLNTVLNWLNEFNLWLKDLGDDNEIDVYEMTKLKKNVERVYQLQTWQRTGGVMIVGYEMFRNLTANNNRMRKKMKDETLGYLIDPGPDVIVCDEGHLLKNEDTALSKSIKRIKTLRRIVLTGTPLQNNLNEYHCMVQFVKPNLLGTKSEFSNRFVNPITNGQFDDSTEYDVKLMKKRAYVLNKMLKGCVQRCDYSVLTPFLPPKQEYVIFVSLTETQINLYRYYLNNFARQGRYTATLFADFQALQRVWTHPYVLRMNSEKIEKLNEKRLDSDSEGSLKDFINDSETDTESSSSSDSSVCIEEDDSTSNAREKSQKYVPRRATRNTAVIDISDEVEVLEKKEEEWWSQFVKPEDLEDMRASSKLMLLFGILKECEQIGDKVLVFSQSLYSLSLIERFLEKIDDGTQNNSNSELIAGHTGSWMLGLDYFRLDGQTSPENRSRWCKIFNRPTNTRARLFLISTRAGGLGINLTAANRVIIFDASWNPSHDVQSIFRVYRFGQKKPCYVYRFLAAGTMEEKIYNRQVTKLSLSCRVLDEQQIERHYSNNDLSELYTFEPKIGEKQTLNLPKDRLLAEIFLKYKDYVENYHEHDSLLENKTEEDLNEEERKQAWNEYQEEKKGKPKLVPNLAMGVPYVQNPLMNNQYMRMPQDVAADYSNLRELLKKDYPNATPEMQQLLTTRAMTEMYNYWEQQTLNATKHLLEQNRGVLPRPIRPKPAPINYAAMNVSANMSNQPSMTINADDDDVIEVSSTSAVNDINKNQEE